MEKKEFENYYLMYANKIYGVAYRILNNHEDSIDVVQEVFLKAFKNLNNFRGLSKFSTYLYRIAVNLSIDILRKKTKLKKIDNINYENFNFFKKNTHDCNEIVDEIKNEIDNLTQKQKTVFILKTYENLTYEEIANILHSKTGTIKAIYFQTIQKIRKNLKEKGVLKNGM